VLHPGHLKSYFWMRFDAAVQLFPPLAPWSSPAADATALDAVAEVAICLLIRAIVLLNPRFVLSFVMVRWCNFWEYTRRALSFDRPCACFRTQDWRWLVATLGKIDSCVCILVRLLHLIRESFLWHESFWTWYVTWLIWSPISTGLFCKGDLIFKGAYYDCKTISKLLSTENARQVAIYVSHGCTIMNM